jgi:hypothetical protein
VFLRVSHPGRSRQPVKQPLNVFYFRGCPHAGFGILPNINMANL